MMTFINAINDFNQGEKAIEGLHLNSVKTITLS